MRTQEQTVKLLDYSRENASDAFVPKPAVLSSSGWDSIHFEFHQQPKFDVAEHQHTMHVIAYGLSCSSLSYSSAERWLDGKLRTETVTEYITEHLHQDVKLIELAAIAQMSPYHFLRLFKQSMGLTPHQYILQRRIEKAKCLLQHSKLSIAEVAANVGFCDQSHFTRYFKRIIGVTPKQLRQARSQ